MSQNIPDDVKHGIVLADALCELLGRMECAGALALDTAVDEFHRRTQVPSIASHDSYASKLLMAMARHYLVREQDAVERMRNGPQG